MPWERRNRCGCDSSIRSKWDWPAPTCHDSNWRRQNASGFKVWEPTLVLSSVAARSCWTDLCENSVWSVSSAYATPPSEIGEEIPPFAATPAPSYQESENPNVMSMVTVSPAGTCGPGGQLRHGPALHVVP